MCRERDAASRERDAASKRSGGAQESSVEHLQFGEMGAGDKATAKHNCFTTVLQLVVRTARWRSSQPPCCENGVCNALKSVSNRGGSAQAARVDLFDKLGQKLGPKHVMRQRLLLQRQADALHVVQQPAAKVSCQRLRTCCGTRLQGTCLWRRRKTNRGRRAAIWSTCRGSRRQSTFASDVSG